MFYVKIVCIFLASLILFYFQSANIPIGVSAKLAQISSIRSAGSSDNVSYMAYLINVITGAARLYTHYMSRGEFMVLANFAIMIFANLGVMITISAYRGQKLKSS